jgi:hypothetical protein
MLTQLSPLKQAVERALRVADEVATPRIEPTLTTSERPDQSEESTMTEKRTTSSLLDLQDPHWTETRQQQMLHKARIPPQPPSPTETNPVDNVKK